MAYNGWKNYETWNVALWAGNDEGLYNTIREHRSAIKRFNRESAADFTMELMPQGTPDFDGKPARYLKVNWAEIARCYNEL